jgi:hypothetical protein
MNITKEIKSIQNEAEKELGFPLVERIWDIVEEDVGNAATDYGDDPEGQEEYIESYRTVTQRYVKILSEQFPIKAKPSTGGNEQPANPKKIYRKPLERRLHLLQYVGNEKGWSKARANWKQITTKWNREHPFDRKTQGVLKVEYYRTLKDKEVGKNLVALRILPGVKLTLAKIRDLWKQHPEVKNLFELFELEEARREGYILDWGKDGYSIGYPINVKLGKDSHLIKVSLGKDPVSGKYNVKIEKQ